MGITIHFKATIEPRRIPELVEGVKSIADHYGWGYVVFEDGEIVENVEVVEPEEDTGKEEEESGDGQPEDKEQGGFRITETIPLSGIMVSPGQGCESLPLLFDKEGQSSHLMGWLLVRDGVIQPEDNWAFVKTQSAPPDVHVTIVELLKFLEKNILTSLKVQDEGGYYETGDLNELRRRQGFINKAIEDISKALSDATPPPEDATADEVADHVEKLIQELWERKKEEE